MPDANNASKSLRDRLTDGTEDKLGKALTDLLENPVLTSVIGRDRPALTTSVSWTAILG